VLAADCPELFVRNEEHVAAAVYVVNLDQLGSWTALTRSNVLAEALRDEPDWRGILRAEKIELRTGTAN
jgi:hypothetical protein